MDTYLKVYDRLHELCDPLNEDPEFIILPEDRLWDDLGFDSLDHVELIMWSEEAFDIDIMDEALPQEEKQCVVARLVELIESKIKPN